jgi:hypothetical protein
MAKISWLERNKRKAAVVKKFAAKRAELKAKRDDAPREPMFHERSSPWLFAQIRLFATHIP